MTFQETVLRPGRGPYRAQKPPRVVPYDNDGDSWGLIVTRTHDIDVATAYATLDWPRFHDRGPEGIPVPRVGWTRVVPWDEGGTGGTETWLDADPTERGAVPCVWFHARWQ